MLDGQFGVLSGEHTVQYQGRGGHFAHPGETSPMPATGVLPEGVLRDDYPLPPRPWCLLTPHRQAFEDTLVRLPAVRATRLCRYRDAYRQAVSPASAG